MCKNIFLKRSFKSGSSTDVHLGARLLLSNHLQMVLNYKKIYYCSIKQMTFYGGHNGFSKVNWRENLKIIIKLELKTIF